MRNAASVERASRDQLAALQSERLARTVRQVYERVPHYRDALNACGVQPEGVRTVEDLSRLPFTTKADIAAHYPYGLCAVDPSEPVRVHSSSGTTGKPVNVFYTRNDLDHWIACVARLLGIAGVQASDVCQIAFKYTLFTGAFGHHRGAESIGATVIPTSSGQTERQLTMMRDLGTTVLHCTPSYAVVIAERLAERGIDPTSLRLRLGIHGAESMSDELRDEVQEGLGVRVARDYGLTEIGGPGVSIECPEQSGYHINEDFYYPEVVDPDTGDPVAEGQLGELVFTTLAKEASPLLRFRTRDLATLTREPCACGRTLARHGPIVGRTDDMLIIGGVNFFPSQLESALLGFAEVAPHYLIILTEENRLDRVTVQVEAHPSLWGGKSAGTLAAVAAKIEGTLEDHIGIRIAVELVEPHALDRTEGKSKRVRDDRRRT